jgi:DNA-binding MarR family transcriptional regulator
VTAPRRAPPADDPDDGEGDGGALRAYLDEPGAAGLFTRLTRAGLLLDAFQHRCLDGFGLRFVDYSVLRVLQVDGRPQPRSPSELAELVLRSSGGMTQILDRLERAGYVERTSDPDDRRKVVVRLTRAGLTVAREAGAAYAAARDDLLGELSDAEVRRMDAAVRRLLEVLSPPG